MNSGNSFQQGGSRLIFVEAAGYLTWRFLSFSLSVSVVPSEIFFYLDAS